MKLNLTSVALALVLPTAVFAQDSVAVSTGNYPNAYTSGSANVSPFTQASKRFNDWAISAGAGIPLMQSSDLTSIKGFGAGKNLYGWSAYLSVDKAKLSEEIIARDKYDSEREISPLRCAEDAFYLDTSIMDKPEVVNKILDICRVK